MHLRLQVPAVILQSSISFFSPFAITKEFNCLQSLNWLGSRDLNCLLFWCIKLNLAFFFLLICFLRSNSFKFQSSLNQVFLLLFLSFLKLSFYFLLSKFRTLMNFILLCWWQSFQFFLPLAPPVLFQSGWLQSQP